MDNEETNSKNISCDNIKCYREKYLSDSYVKSELFLNETPFEYVKKYNRNLPPLSDWERGLRILCDSNEPPVVLVDMDNTLVDWEAQFERLMGKHYPQISIVPPMKRKQFEIELNYDDQYRDSILHLTSFDEFWLSMDPIQGSIQALKEMVEIGMLVFIVTTPDAKHTSRSAFEKIAWVERQLGPEWKYKSVLTHDKTLVKGDILIDDKPTASIGLLQPSWTHTLFAQPYNICNTECPRIDNWFKWGEVLYKVLYSREILKKNVLHNDSVENKITMNIMNRIIKCIGKEQCEDPFNLNSNNPPTI